MSTTQLTSLLTRVFHSYSEASQLAVMKLTYIFGGGHNPEFKPDPGVDCSSFASIVLRAGGLLRHPTATQPFITQEFETWGLAGEGRYLTVWALDVPAMAAIPEHAEFAAYLASVGETHHCALDFHGRPEFAHRWAQAANPKIGVGWISFDPIGFHARHWSGT